MSKAYLAITLKIDETDRADAAAVYTKFKAPFLDTVKGATSKELLIRNEDVQVLHGFVAADDAAAYLSGELFNKDVVVALHPFLKDHPDIKIYTVL